MLELEADEPAGLDPTQGLAELDRVLNAARRAVLRPPPHMNVPDWADKYRHLSPQVSSTAGPWLTSRVEVARGPLMAVTEPGVRKITAMTCTQVLKTELLLNTIGYHAHLDPGPILLLQPKDEMASAFSKERIAPMVQYSPELTKIMSDPRTRNSDDTLQFKKFPGGFLAMASAGSASNLAMRAIRITLLDEVDKYVTTKEGDPVLLAEERTSTFSSSSLKIRACSPTIEEGRIYKSYMSGDQRRPFVACPHCGHWQDLDFFRHVHWQKTEDGEHLPDTAHIHCESCGTEWSEAERIRIMTTKHAIRHQQTRKFKCCDEDQNPLETRLWDWDPELQVGYAKCKHCGGHPVSNEHASFTASKLYSPFDSVVDLVSKWLEARSDPESKQTFYNTQLGQPYKTEIHKPLAGHALMARREQFEFPVPAGAITLTCGVDVQTGAKGNDGRLEIEVVAWGLHEESWSIETHVISGNLSTPTPWQELDAYLAKGFACHRGFDLYIAATCIDSGGNFTQEVYNFARARVGRNIWAIKGANDQGGAWSTIWPAPAAQNKKHQKTRTGWKPIIVGVNEGKAAIRERLLIETPGPGYCHFPLDREEGYFEQLTSEELNLVSKHGVTIRKWVKKFRDRANEMLDCRVYAYAALHGLYIVRQLSLERQLAVLDAYIPPAPNGASTGRGRRVQENNWVGGN